MKNQFFLGCCVCLVSALCAAPAPEPQCIWPADGMTVVPGDCVSVTRVGDMVQVDVGACRKTVWPAVYFRFAATTNLSDAGAVRVTLTNRTDAALVLHVKIKATTVQGRVPDAGTTLPPHAAKTFCLPLRLERWVFDADPKLKGLKRNPAVGGGSSYALERTHAISVYAPQGASDISFGVLRMELEPGDGKPSARGVLKAADFNPWVDEFGQARFAEWPEKVRAAEDLRRRGAEEAAALAARPDGIPEADRFGGWAGGPQLKATGFFRTEKIDGRWWLVDPDGHLFFSHGVNCGWELAPTGISGREAYFEKLPPKEGATKQFWTLHTKPSFRNFYSDTNNVPYWTFSFSGYDLWLKHGDGWRQANVETTARRMRAWGLNTATGASGELRKMRTVPYVTSIGPRARPIEGANGYWGKLLDPFAPEFAESCAKAAAQARAYGTNEWCLGWTSNNELSWGRDGASLARDVLASPDGQPAKVALLRMLSERGLTPETAKKEDFRLLGEAVAEKYYATVRAAIKSVAPNHLYIGDRNDKKNPETLRAASRYLDVVTVNTYDYQPTVQLPKGSEDKPLLVTEFHFGCYDTGYFYASLIPVKDQRTRAACYRTYAYAAVDNPNYVGVHWFCWRDCPITGQLGEGANAQCGLVSTTDIPYAELVGAIREVSATMYRRRAP
ncbi:MAG: hypothetical protein ACI4Q3_03725 [Kiritimatiellia bacterium]